MHIHHTHLSPLLRCRLRLCREVGCLRRAVRRSSRFLCALRPAMHGNPTQQ
jgi:hypothetical protein